METQVQNRFTRLTPRNIAVISLITFILLTLAVAAQVTYTVLNYKHIYNGVYINGHHAGNYNPEELTAQMKKEYKDKLQTLQFELKADHQSQQVRFLDLDVAYDVDAAVNGAYRIGRSGNIFQRVSEIVSSGKNGVSISVPATLDRKKLESTLDLLYNKTQVSVKEPSLILQNDKVILRSGHHGISFDRAKLMAEMEEKIKAGKGGPIEVAMVNTSPMKIDVTAYYNQLNLPPKDALVQVENGNIKVTPHTLGRSIEKSTLAAIVADLEKQEDTEKVLPVVFSNPQITTEDVNARLFKDTLYTMSTQFYTDNQNNSNRGENIRIAVSKINGKLLAPGDVFSFNDVVGPRTEDAGYKIAHAYSAGKVIDDVGGGICQVSSTLYNSVLLSDLDIIERTNHMFTVGYVPFGRDAAVSYDSVDFKFRNSTKWPIKIEGWVTGDNRVFFALRGTNENKDKTIDINSQIVKTLDFTTKYVDDPNQDEGITQVKTEGMNGYIVDTTKIVKQNGKIISQDKIHTSTYKPLDREVIRGTRKPTPTAAAPTAGNVQKPTSRR